MNEVASAGIPYFAGSIVAASDEFVTIFVEAAVGEGKNMSLQLFY